MAQKRIKVKPGKTQSKIGFGVGIVFVLIGIFIVIPIFGTFGIFWTAVAGFIAFSHYRNGFTDKGMPTHEIVVDESDEIFAGSTKHVEEDIEAKLLKLESLYNQGLINHEEYEAKRKEFLDAF